jgi:hypothetical protein
MFSKEELRDLLSAVEFDTQGSHGDDRAKRLDKLESKIKKEINKLS